MRGQSCLEAGSGVSIVWGGCGSGDSFAVCLYGCLAAWQFGSLGVRMFVGLASVELCVAVDFFGGAVEEISGRLFVE